MALETTLILFKPDAVEKKIVGTVLARYEAAGFRVRGIKMLALTDEVLAEHYSHIADKPFFPGVRDFMQESPVIALALEGEDVITKVRDLLGPTDSTQAAAGTIRGDFGFKDAAGVSRLANDPNAKAKRLARALVSDIVVYFPQKREEGLRDGTLKQLFREEIKKSYEEYVEQVGREFAESTTHFQDALNDVLAGGKKLF